MKWLVILLSGVCMLNVSAQELVASAKKDCINCGRKLSGFEDSEKLGEFLTGDEEKLRRVLCSSSSDREFETYKDPQSNSQFPISRFEKNIYYTGLGLKKENVFQDLSLSSLRIQFKKLDEFWSKKNIWSFQCTEDDDPELIFGEEGLVQYIALNFNYELFNRLFLSGAYDLDIVNSPINSKKQTFFEWLEDKLINKPSMYDDDITLKHLQNFHDLMIKHYPALKDKSLMARKG